MPFDFGKADAINPGQQANEVLMPVFALDRVYRLSCFGSHDVCELQVKVADREKLNKLILKVKELETFFRVGNLQDELLT